MESRYDYVLLGGGTSCGYAARGIRELDKEGTVCIISADSEPPYDRPPFSKGYLKNDAMDVSDAHSNEESFYAENKIDVRLNAEATSIDLAGKSVTLADGTKVLDCSSDHNPKFVYRAGKIVKPDSYDASPTVECSNGIHFFVTYQEALDW